MSVPFALVAALLGFVGFKTRPDANSFRAYITNTGGSNNNNNNGSSSSTSSSSSTTTSSWMGKISKFVSSVTAPRVPEFKLTDYLVCVVVTTDDGRAFLGIFNSWFPLETKDTSTAGYSRVALTEGGSSSGGGGAVNVEEEAERIRDAAVQSKTQRDYVRAAELFIKGGQKLSSVTSSSSSSATTTTTVDAAKCFEDAAICFGLVEQVDKARNARIRAGELYEQHPRALTRAAKAYETVGDEYMSTGSEGSAITYFEKAKDCFERDGDGRAFSIDPKIAECLARMGRFQNALDAFESCAQRASNDQVLKFSVAGYLMNALFCSMALRDDVGFALLSDKYEGMYPMFSTYSESGFAKSVCDAWSDGNVAALDKAVERFKSINQSMSSWQLKSLQGVRGM